MGLTAHRGRTTPFLLLGLPTPPWGQGAHPGGRGGGLCGPHHVGPTHPRAADHPQHPVCRTRCAGMARVKLAIPSIACAALHTRPFASAFTSYTHAYNCLWVLSAWVQFHCCDFGKMTNVWVLALGYFPLPFDIPLQNWRSWRTPLAPCNDCGTCPSLGQDLASFSFLPHQPQCVQHDIVLDVQNLKNTSQTFQFAQMISSGGVGMGSHMEQISLQQIPGSGSLSSSRMLKQVKWPSRVVMRSQTDTQCAICEGVGL